MKEGIVRLSRFQVRKFRNVVDSGVIPVEGEVTCLVGMNESDKTAILSALHRLNPVDDATFDVQQDYPRWLMTKDRRGDVIATVRPIEAVFTLDESDLALVQTTLGEEVLRGSEVTVHRRYDDTTLYWQFDWDPQRAMTNLVQRLDLSPKATATLTGLKDFPALAVAVAKAQEALGSDDEDYDEISGALSRLAEEIARATNGAPTGTVIRRLLTPRLPEFFYFSDYSALPGRIDIQELSSQSTDPGSTPLQTARSLLALANTTPQSLAGDDYEDRKAELEAVSNDLTRQVFEYWKQNPNLRVRFDLDRKIENGQYGPRMVQNVLDIRVEDTHHYFTNNFSQRSSGFRWFFSFLAAFTEFEDRNEPVVVLLDESGLTLHGRAQADFLRFINERLANAGQVLYSTHSPFMVETDRLNRVRIVEDAGPDKGAVVTKEALTVNDDSLFPLQAALGYDVAQHLFIGDANLLVEGSSDLLYLDTISHYLATQNRTSLDDPWRILPAGGAANIPAFVTLLGRNLDVTVLIDAGTEGTGRLQTAMQAGRLDANRLIPVSEITGRRNSDIEDLFTEDDYLTLYDAAYGTTLTAADLGPGDRIIKRIEQKTGRFDHYKPAEVLLRDQATILPQLSDTTLDAFARLNQRINATR